MIDSETTDRALARSESILWDATATLERAAAGRVPALRGIVGAIDRDGPLAARAAVSHARTCLVSVIERCSPEEVRQVSIDLDALLAASSAKRSARTMTGSTTQPTTESTTQTTEWASLVTSVREWSRIAATAVGRRGSITANRALRTRHGKGAQVLAMVVNATAMQATRQDILAAHPGPETTWVSHVLTELESAGLIVRWTEGRETIVSATGLGRDTAEANDLMRRNHEQAHGAPAVVQSGTVIEINKYAAFVRNQGQPIVRPAPVGQSALSQLGIAEPSSSATG